MKEWHSKGVMEQVSLESNWKQSSWGQKKRKNAYQRRRGAAGKEIQKNWEIRLKEEQERENCNNIIGLRVFSFQPNPLYLEKAVSILINNLFVPYHLVISFLDLPLWNFYPCVLIN